jgi:hypothetical protein
MRTSKSGTVQPSKTTNSPVKRANQPKRTKRTTTTVTNPNTATCVNDCECAKALDVVEHITLGGYDVQTSEESDGTVTLTFTKHPTLWDRFVNFIKRIFK